MPSVRLVVALALATCACTQNFDVFVGDGGSDEAGDASDAAPADAATDAPVDGSSCNVSQTCLAPASQCGQSCLTGYNTCMAGCANQPCKNQCKGQETTCQSVCTSQCQSCADAGACAQTACKAALP